MIPKKIIKLKEVNLAILTAIEVLEVKIFIENIDNITNQHKINVENK